MTVEPNYFTPKVIGPSYVDFLQNELPLQREQWAAEAEARRQALSQAMAQQVKNQSAPVIGGSSSSSFGGGNTGALPANFKTVGGKVVPVAGRVSQGWGKSRIHYAAGRHTGMDFGVPVGTAVRSAGNGIVTYVGREGAYGNVVKVRQADGTYALYAHLSGAGVRRGQRVRSGQRIASSGNTGRSTGAHLHFEIRTRDRYGGDVNPVSWLRR